MASLKTDLAIPKTHRRQERFTGQPKWFFPATPKMLIRRPRHCYGNPVLPGKCSTERADSADRRVRNSPFPTQMPRPFLADGPSQITMPQFIIPRANRRLRVAAKSVPRRATPSEPALANSVPEQSNSGKHTRSLARIDHDSSHRSRQEEGRPSRVCKNPSRLLPKPAACCHREHGGSPAKGTRPDR